MTNDAVGHYSWVGSEVEGVVWGDIPTPGLPENKVLSQLDATMRLSDPVSRALAADDIAEYKEYYDKTWVITIYDYLWRPMGSSATT